MLKKYEISAFLRLDPIIEGMQTNVTVNIDLFSIELQNELDNYIGRNDILYNTISEFKWELEKYTGNLGVIMFPDDKTFNRFLYLPPYNGFDSNFKEKNDMVRNFRINLNQLLIKITNL